MASALVLIPLIVNLVLTNKKRKDLQALEEKTTVFLYNIMYNFRQKLYAKLSFYKPLEDFLTQKLTAYIWKAMFFSTGRLVLIVIFFFLPWLIFIGFFYFELFSQAFFISVYVFAGWLFVMRVFSVCLFLAKITVWEIFSHKLNKQSPELYFYTINFVHVFWHNLNFLTDLIFDKTKEELFNFKQNKTSWKNFNQIIYYHHIYSIIFDFWWNVLPKIKHFIYVLNFIFVTAGVLIYYLENITVRFWIIVITPSLVIYIFQKHFPKSEEEELIFQFAKGYPYFIYSLQYRLIIERNYSKFDYATGLTRNLPQITKNTWFDVNYYTSVKFLIITSVMLIFGISSVNSPEAFEFWVEHLALSLKN